MNARANSKDAFAKEALDRARRAATQRDGTLAVEACAMLDELARAGYRMLVLADPAAIAARPVRIRASFEGSCATCGVPIGIDDPIFWTRGASGVDCRACGEAR